MEEIKVGDIVSLISSERYTYTVGRIQEIEEKPIATLFYLNGITGDISKFNVPVAALKKQ